jgi:hypothetical protein
VIWLSKIKKKGIKIKEIEQRREVG